MPGQGIDEQLRFAIANERLLQFTYKGAGSSGRPNERMWRLFDVEQVAGCVVLGESFPGSRGHQHSSHHDWDVVYARVD
jgi:hypothetical protein